MRAGDDPELPRLIDPGEAHEVLQRVLVRAPSALVVDVREPLELGRDIGQAPEAGGIEPSPAGRNRNRR